MRTFAVLAVFVLTGCELSSTEARETQRESRAIELDSSESVRVQIRMGAGELHVTSGTPKLLQADFTYNLPDWRPEVEYRRGTNGGGVAVSPPAEPGRAV